MVRLFCDGIYQPAKIMRIVPTKSGVSHEFVFYLKNCSVCSKPALEIIRIDMWGKIIPPVRLNTRNIADFLKTINVIPNKEPLVFSKPYSRFYLCYNNFGKKEKCYQNLSRLKIGAVETDPVRDLQFFKGN